MKKTCFAGIAVLLALAIVSCDFTAAPQQNNEPPSVQYSRDGTSITLRLDGEGGVDRNMSRALTDLLAKRGHDYFEVVFTDGTDIARASWEIGQPAGIRNVPRNGTDGVDYSTADASASAASPVLDGSAILFVGRKADKTLLAVGLLTATENFNGSPGGPVVSTATRTATFTVGALMAGTSFTATSSSFWTATAVTAPADTTTTIDRAVCDGTPFPMYRIANGAASILTSYTFDSKGTLTDYLPGIKLAGIPTNNVDIRIPRFPRGGGFYTEFETPHALGTNATIMDISTPGTPVAYTATTALPASIGIVFNTSATIDGAISFAFDIPVYAITNDNSQAGVPEYITWHVKPGFGTNYYDLDNGNSPMGLTAATDPDSYGGSILLGVGDNVTLDYLGIRTTWLP